jgi:hypothetical protein
MCGTMSENPCTAIFRTGRAKAAGMDAAKFYCIAAIFDKMGNPGAGKLRDLVRYRHDWSF